MKDDYKSEDAYKTIGEAAKELNLINKKTGRLQTHTIRYWEKQFKQIKPIIKAGNRRYYSSKNIKILNYIKFLLKEKGLTINGVKRMLNEKNTVPIDDASSIGIYNPSLKSANTIKNKLKKINKIIKELKKI